MTKISLGINTCFALKRWLEPKEWMKIIGSELDLNLCEISFDLLDPNLRPPTKFAFIQEITELCDLYEITIFSTHTGMNTYHSNMCLHPNLGFRMEAIKWFEKAIDVTAGLYGNATGGNFGDLSFEQIINLKNDDQNDIILDRDNLISDFNNSQYSLYFLEDAILYIAKIAFNAGLDHLLFEPYLPNSERDYSIKIYSKFLENLNKQSEAPIKFSLSTEKHNNLDIYRKYAENTSEIHLSQSDGEFYRYWPFTAGYNKRGMIDLKRIIEILDDSETEDCKLLLNVIPSPNQSNENALEELKESVSYIKDFI